MDRIETGPGGGGKKERGGGFQIGTGSCGSILWVDMEEI